MGKNWSFIIVANTLAPVCLRVTHLNYQCSVSDSFRVVNSPLVVIHLKGGFIRLLRNSFYASMVGLAALLLDSDLPLPRMVVSPSPCKLSWAQVGCVQGTGGVGSSAAHLLPPAAPAAVSTPIQTLLLSLGPHPIPAPARGSTAPAEGGFPFPLQNSNTCCGARSLWPVAGSVPRGVRQHSLEGAIQPVF